MKGAAVVTLPMIWLPLPTQPLQVPVIVMLFTVAVPLIAWKVAGYIDVAVEIAGIAAAGSIARIKSVAGVAGARFLCIQTKTCAGAAIGKIAAITAAASCCV